MISKQLSKNKEEQTKKKQSKSEQQQKWKILQAKYLEYIKLLKRKIDHAENKLSQLSKTSTVENSAQNNDKSSAVILCNRIQMARQKILSTTFYNIKIAAYKESEDSLCDKTICVLKHKIQFDNKIKFIEGLRKLKVQKELKSTRMLYVLKIVQKIRDNLIRSAFQKISTKKQGIRDKNRLNKFFSNLQDKIKLNNLIAFMKIKKNNQKNVKGKQNIVKNLKYLKNLLTFDKILSIGQPNSKSLHIEIAKLQTQVQRLKLINQQLRKQLIVTAQQRQRQVLKKSQGLELLAEDLRQKDEIIEQYQKQLEVHRGIKSKSVLTLSAAEYQLEKRRLEQLNHRLNEQIIHKDEVFKEEKQKYLKDIKELREKEQNWNQNFKKMSAQLDELRNYKFQKEYQISYLQTEKKSLMKMQKNIDFKQKQILAQVFESDQNKKIFIKIGKILRQNTQMNHKIYRIEELVKSREVQTNQQSPIKVKNADVLQVIERMVERDGYLSLQDQIKDTNLYLRIKNIEEKLNNLFSELGELRQTHKNQVMKIRSKNKGIDSKDCSDEVYLIKNKSKDLMASSVFEAFTQRHNSPDSIIERMPTSSNRNQNFTIKLIELQNLVKKKQQAIFSQKQKVLHLRSIILKLLKSLQLKSTLPRETDEILQILFDFMEYSEEEKSQIFSTKKTGFFGFFK